ARRPGPRCHPAGMRRAVSWRRAPCRPGRRARSQFWSLRSRLRERSSLSGYPTTGMPAIVLLLVLATAGMQIYSEGAIVRGPVGRKHTALVFTGHEFAEGATAILDVLERRGMKASFFLTGAFLRDPDKAPLVRRMVRDGHYVGAHSDAHLLYAPWT